MGQTPSALKDSDSSLSIHFKRRERQGQLISSIRGLHIKGVLDLILDYECFIVTVPGTYFCGAFGEETDHFQCDGITGKTTMFTLRINSFFCLMLNRATQNVHPRLPVKLTLDTTEIGTTRSLETSGRLLETLAMSWNTISRTET